MELFKCNAFAKLNLHLRIIDKKTNGNHLLQMLSLPISLYDSLEITIHPDKKGVQVFLDPPMDILMSDNLVYRAVIKYWKGSPPGMTINLNKGIPVQAGLGGGSSDAASILIVMNRLFQHYSDEDLLQLGFTLGADVPFFIQGKESIITGEGEILTPTTFFIKQYFFVILKPYFSLPTGVVYQKWDNLACPFSKPIVFSRDNIFSFYNDLILAAKTLEPSLSNVLEDIRNTSPLAYSMTGSGSACFGVFAEKSAAEKARLTLLKKYPFIHLATNILHE